MHTLGTNGLSSISEYADSVRNSEGLFRTLTNIEYEKDFFGNVNFRAGNNSAVFRITSNQSDTMLKCYIKKPLHPEEIYGYISSHPDPLLAHTTLLKDEIYVYDSFDNGQYYDVVVSDWVTGNTLETEIRKAVNHTDTGTLERLSGNFDRMAMELLGREWAHGDLKPENIIVMPDGNMKLIDYDAMFIPSLAGLETSELGTPPYQHPLRNEKFYNKRSDDYAIAMISVSLFAISVKPDLYTRFNRYDNIIMYPDQILQGTSAAFTEIMNIFSASENRAREKLANGLLSPLPAIESIESIIGECLKI